MLAEGSVNLHRRAPFLTRVGTPNASRVGAPDFLTMAAAPQPSRVGGAGPLLDKVWIPQTFHELERPDLLTRVGPPQLFTSWSTCLLDKGCTPNRSRVKAGSPSSTIPASAA